MFKKIPSNNELFNWNNKVILGKLCYAYSKLITDLHNYEVNNSIYLKNSDENNICNLGPAWFFFK